VVALLLGALWYESGWLIRLVALAVMFELSFCEFAFRRTRARVLRGGRYSILASRLSVVRFLPMPPWAVFARPATLQGWTLPERKRLSGSSMAGVLRRITGGPLSRSRSETVLRSWSLSTTSPSHIRKSQIPHASQERSMGHPAQVPTSRSGLSEVLLLFGPRHRYRLADARFLNRFPG
jgi:hypothetical protein